MAAPAGLAAGTGLRGQLKRPRGGRLKGLALPAMARMADGGWLVLARAAVDRVLVFAPATGEPRPMARAASEAGWSGKLLLVDQRPIERWLGGGQFGVGCSCRPWPSTGTC
ncbi:MAG TPA: hypothetical protein VED40_02005 [Azospirillaceae bacterium]|nr:hypothetical protein [Azospirillaceae bacterium]